MLKTQSNVTPLRLETPMLQNRKRINGPSINNPRKNSVPEIHQNMTKLEPEADSQKLKRVKSLVPVVVAYEIEKRRKKSEPRLLQPQSSF